MTQLPTSDLNITWLLQHLQSVAAPKDRTLSTCFAPAFTIDRALPSCKTPRRNEPVEQALTFGTKLSEWSTKAAGYFMGTLLPIDAGGASRDISALKVTY
jgi:hypothetical protein